MKKIYNLTLFGFFLNFAAVYGQTVVFVAADAAGNNDGTSWGNAFNDLEEGLVYAWNNGSVEQVWVKSGTYYPTSGTDRSAIFSIYNDLVVYGGFNGTESSLTERDHTSNPTILSGNIGDPNLSTDNSFNLVTAMGNDPKLDGFILQDTYDMTTSTSGAIRLPNLNGFQNFTVRNCEFRDNTASGVGCIRVYNGALNVDHCVFKNNDVLRIISNDGNAAYQIHNNVFINNPNATAIRTTSSLAGAVTNNTIYGNNTGVFALSSALEIHNNIIWGNASEVVDNGMAVISNNIIEDTVDPNNTDLDPGFKDVINGDFSITICSAARNLGNNSYVTQTTDVEGGTRIIDTTVDLGAYEVQGFDLQITALETLDIVCFGESTGEVGIGAVGGVGNLEYSLDGVNYQTDPVFTGLPSGTYVLTVKDADGCNETSAFDILELATAVLVPSASITDITCPGDASGEISASASGGVGPYAYSIDGLGFQSSGTFASLSAGSYDVYVQDAVGCVKTTSATVNEPTAITLSTFVIHDVSCNGGTDGSIDVEATGGNGGTFTYSIAAGTSSKVGYTSLINLSAGDYDITVADGLGCEAVFSATVAEPDALSLTLDVTDLPCNGTGTGSIDAVVTGGTAPYEYSIDGVNYQSSESFTQLALGNYTITVQDANGCSTSGSGTVGEPAKLAVSLTATDLACNGDNSGSISVIASGGTTPYAYSIDGTNFQTADSFTGLAPAQYTITVQDANGCQETGVATISEPTELGISLTATDLTCNGDNSGSISATASGGTAPYEFSVDGASFQSSNLFALLSAGEHTVTAKDANGCTAANTVTITEPASLEVTASFDGSVVNVEATGGTSPYEYSLDGTVFQSSNSFELVNGQYTITARDASGCTSTTTQQIVITGLEPVALAGVEVYPNPVQDVLYLSAKEKIKEVTVLSMNGSVQNVYGGGTDLQEINLNSLDCGFYIVRVELMSGGFSFHKVYKE